MSNERNGELDFLKFIFSIFIMTFHYHYRPVILSIRGHNLMVAENGGYAVVFYFIVSGALFTMSAKRQSEMWDYSAKSIANDVKDFIFRKYIRFIKLYLIAIVITVADDIIFKRTVIKSLVDIFYTIPFLFLLEYTGFENGAVYQGGYHLVITWYLSALMIMYLLFYPLIRRNYDIFVKVLSPIIFVISLYINLSVLHSPIKGSRLYPVIPFLLGVIIAEIALSEKVKLLSFSKVKKIAVECIAILCYVMLMVYLCLDTNKMLFTEYPMLFITGLGVLITCSGVFCFEFFNRSFFYFLGELSFVIYVLHVPVQSFCNSLLERISFKPGENAIFFMTALATIGVSCIVVIISRKRPALCNLFKK